MMGIPPAPATRKQTKKQGISLNNMSTELGTSSYLLLTSDIETWAMQAVFIILAMRNHKLIKATNSDQNSRNSGSALVETQPQQSIFLHKFGWRAAESFGLLFLFIKCQPNKCNWEFTGKLFRKGWLNINQSYCFVGWRLLTTRSSCSSLLTMAGTKRTDIVCLFFACRWF